MRFLITTIVTTLLVNYSVAQNWASTPQISSKGVYDLNGDVNTVYEYLYAVGEDSVRNIKTKTTLLFNESGRLTDSSVKLFDDKGDVSISSKKIIYAKGKVIAETNRSNDRIVDSVSFIYSRKGQLKQKLMFDNRLKLTERIVFTHLRDQIITIRRRRPDNTMENMLRLHYNGANSKEIELLDEALKTVWREEQLKEFKDDSTIYVTSYYYNADNVCTRMESTTTDRDGCVLDHMVMNGKKEPEAYYSYEYDKHRLVKAKSFIGEAEKNLTYTYKYDKRSNVTDILVFNSGVLETAVHRDIIYSN